MIQKQNYAEELRHQIRKRDAQRPISKPKRSILSEGSEHVTKMTNSILDISDAVSIQAGRQPALNLHQNQEQF